MKPLGRQLFLWLILAQVAHSVEEYLFRLYEVLAPARWVSGLFTDNLALGFALANTCIVLLGLGRGLPESGVRRSLDRAVHVSAV